MELKIAIISYKNGNVKAFLGIEQGIGEKNGVWCEKKAFRYYTNVWDCRFVVKFQFYPF